jgi:hypothetical protein
VKIFLLPRCTSIDEPEEKTVMSGVAERPYCKGRAYDPDRYSKTEE